MFKWQRYICGKGTNCCIFTSCEANEFIDSHLCTSPPSSRGQHGHPHLDPWCKHFHSPHTRWAQGRPFWQRPQGWPVLIKRMAVDELSSTMSGKKCGRLWSHLFNEQFSPARRFLLSCSHAHAPSFYLILDCYSLRFWLPLVVWHVPLCVIFCLEDLLGAGCLF